MQSKTFATLCTFVAKLKGSRSPRGREWAARIMKAIQPCRLQNRSPWAFILDAVNAKKPSLSAAFSTPVNILNGAGGVNGYSAAIFLERAVEALHALCFVPHEAAAML